MKLDKMLSIYSLQFNNYSTQTIFFKPVPLRKICLKFTDMRQKLHKILALLAIIVGLQVEAQITNGLLHEFNFNNSYTSTLGTATFSNIGQTSFVTDRNGNASSALNINNGYAIATIANMPTSSNQRTISLWVKLNTFNSLGFNYIYSYGPGSSANGVYLNATTVNHYALNFGNNTNHSISTPHTLNTWVHYAFTYDGSRSRIYKNGILIGTTVQNISTVSNNSFSMGVTEGGGIGYLNGAVDELKIYNRALSASEVYEIYGQIPSTPVVQWNFNGNTTANGGLYAFSTPAGTGLNNDRFNNANSALFMNNSGSVATGVAPLPLGNNPRTISFWFKRSQSDFQELFVYGSSGNQNCYGLNVSGSGAFANYHTNNGSLYTVLSSSSNQPIAPDTWHMITVVYTQDSSKIYRNGVVIAELPNSVNLTTTGTNLRLGMVLTSSSNPFQGTIDEIKVYNGALSPLEIAGSYNTALPVFIKHFNAQLNNQKAILNWSTATEINSSHFDVEYSNDAKDFTKATTIQAKGNSHIIQSYAAVIDINNQTTHYFRLKALDKDGKFTYSNIIKLSSTKTIKTEVYPTIATTTVNVNITAQTNSKANIQIISADGRITQQQNWVLQQGTQNKMIDVSQLTKGMYFVIISNNDIQEKFFIVKE